MSEEVHSGMPRGDAFHAVDPSLNVFALANGMDLSKGSDYRRLEWFSEGFERGILVEPREVGAFQLSVIAWPTGSDEIRGRTSVGDGLSAADLIALLPSAIESANEL